MPIHEYTCECGYEVEKVQAMGIEPPACPQCGGVMRKEFSPTANLRVKWDNITQRSKGYKEGYKKEYLKSKGQEEWRGSIVSS